MTSWLREAAEELEQPGTTGSWERRFVEGVVNAGTFNGATVGPLSGRGSWLQQLYLALDPRPAYAGASWIQRLCGGGGRELLGVIMVGGQEVEPYVFSDYVNGINTVDGESVTAAELLGYDPEIGEWDPSSIVNGVGLVGGNDSNPIFIGEALTLVTAGSTIVATFTMSGAFNEFRFELLDSTNYETYYGMKFQDTGLGNSVMEDNSSSETFPGLADGAHKVAFTMIDGAMAASVNGGEPTVYAPADPWTPPMGLMWFKVGSGVTLKTLGIYPPQETSELASLSTP